MIANYGYTDAEGAFYITIDTGKCEGCEAKPCVPACPRSLFVEEEDPYGEDVVAIDDAKRKKLNYECAGCKPSGERAPLPCVAACPYDAVTHSW
jgi:Fe-S-cluster-containing hydrogenase component 2